MQSDFITRVIGLMQKTGDRVILADAQSGKAVVMLDLDAYEKLLAPPQAQSEPVRSRDVLRPPLEERPKTVPAPVEQRRELPRSDFRRRDERGQQPRPERPLPRPPEPALTQSEPADKINRDNGGWKSAPLRENTESEQPATNAEQAPAFEEEERFFLEPAE